MRTSSSSSKRYRLIRELGSGGMGVVYEARMAMPLGGELPVALKVLRADVMRCGVGANRQAPAGQQVSSRPSGESAGGIQSLYSAASAGESDAPAHPAGGPPAMAGARRERETEPLHTSGGSEQDIGQDVQGSDSASLSTSLERLSGVSLSMPNYSRLLMREAVTAMRFNHNHINLATAYDFGISTTGCCFLVMELVDGPSLRSLRRRSRMPYPCIRRIAIDILDGLSFLHGNGVLHRDISSGNILLSRGGPAKLVDFGLAKQIESTHSGVVRGTVAYASPEALQGSRLDARSDLYSLAAVFYELISGQPPYGNDEPVPTYINMLRTEPDALPSDTPSDLRALVLGLLALEPSERRFASALDALEFLCQHGEQVADDHEMGALLSSYLGPDASAANACDSADAAPLDRDEAIADPLLWVEHDPSAESALFGRWDGEGRGSLFDEASGCGVSSGSEHGAAGTIQGVAEPKPRRRGKQVQWVMLLLCVAGVLGTSPVPRRGGSQVEVIGVTSARSADSRCTSPWAPWAPWAEMSWTAACGPGTLTTAVDDTFPAVLASVDVKTGDAPPTPEIDLSATHTIPSRELLLQPEIQDSVRDSGGADEFGAQSGAPQHPQDVRQTAGTAKPSTYSVPNVVQTSVWIVEDRIVEDRIVEDRTVEEPVQP